MNNTAIQEQSVQATMLLPLWGRAKYSSKNPDILDDKEAKRIINSCDFNFSNIEKGFGEFSGLCYIVRARKIDDKIRTFIKKHPRATIVNIGSGLDTTFSRIDNGQIHWYNLDLPDAVAFRNQYIQTDNPRSTDIAKSFLDPAWFDDVIFNPKDGILFVSGGVFYYFHEEDLEKIFAAMAERFPGGELFFDAETKGVVKKSNRMVLKTGNRNAMMYFSVNEIQKFESWSPKIKAVAHIPVFKDIRIKKEWGFASRIALKLFANSKKMAFVLLRFKF